MHVSHDQALDAQCVAVSCSVLQYVAYIAVCCSVVQCVCCSVLQFVAVCCSMLQYVAVCWRIIEIKIDMMQYDLFLLWLLLLYVISYFICNLLHRVARPETSGRQDCCLVSSTYSNTLQHATRCNMQHIATCTATLRLEWTWLNSRQSVYRTLVSTRTHTHTHTACCSVLQRVAACWRIYMME